MDHRDGRRDRFLTDPRQASSRAPTTWTGRSFRQARTPGSSPSRARQSDCRHERRLSAEARALGDDGRPRGRRAAARRGMHARALRGRYGAACALVVAGIDAHVDEKLSTTPPCLLIDGAVHPELLRDHDKAWAGHATDLTTRRRSAAGIDQTGHVLFYAIGEEAEPRWLAEGLRRVGATTALELDINWYWTRFLLFGRDDRGQQRVSDTLIPKMEHLSNGYVERASARDFFFFTTR